jgi:CBS domain-containing protein
MKVSEVMTKRVLTCHLGDSLNAVARQMWDNRCGCLVVVAGLGKPIAIVTDRDVCMAAYTQGKPLGEIAVSTAASHDVETASPTDSVEKVLARMRAARIRRMPVVDEHRRLLGIVSTFDIARRTDGLLCPRPWPAASNGAHSVPIG